MSVKIAGAATLLLAGIMLIAGRNAGTEASVIAQRQVTYDQRLACAASPQCNDPVAVSAK